MSLYKKILVLSTETADSLPALERALTVAHATDAEVTVLDVVEPLSESDAAAIGPSLFAALQQARAARRDAVVTALAARARSTGVDAHTRMAAGKAYRVAIEAVAAEGYDLLVKSVDATSERSRSSFGSTDKHLLRKCPCPVWLVADEAEQASRCVLAAVNPDPADPEDHALSVEILKAAAAIAALEGAELHVLHAWKVLGELLLRGPAPLVSDPEVDAFVGQTLNQHTRFLDDLLDRVPSKVPPKRHLVHARPADAIIEFVQSNPVDLLVLGTVGRTGVPGFFIGNTAERVLSEIACSVLALKPRGFVSPVVLDSR